MYIYTPLLITAKNIVILVGKKENVNCGKMRLKNIEIK